ncbi:hypothetical protein MH117_00690 [Paenibacillus sp. ACRRX]|uniref:hypothetical protein n=1 Tax=unclassified Paenibacillus TaxID=185978 RepID=UPI001EF5D958|nr:MULTISPECIES: hypothetical protein [unclassified Paenibacillus]MCG7405920.1 hypothetical protein [Paenibacillus sp. ACRRX]MDK8182374.1 hypothetical protein [Paenibacillus sp. UMB4589-SE434]
MNIPVWQYSISMIGYIVLLLVIVGVMRKHYKFAHWFWIASLLTFPLWLMGGVEGWFRWAKILSVILPTIFVGFIRIANYEKREGRFWSALQKDWVLWFVYGVLFLNIMEATIKDFTMGNTFNALTGLLLCITIPFAPKYWKISNQKHGDLIVYTTIGWNFMYTTWNAAFVYAESPKFFASSLCILLAAELYPIIKRRPELYIIARVYTLAAHLLLRACFVNLFPTLMDASSWYNADVMNYWGIANFVLMVPFVFWHMWQLHTGKAEVSFRRGRTELN